MFKLAESETVKCWFNRDQLYRVEYHPLDRQSGPEEQVKTTSQGVLRTLRDRYGAPEMPTDRVDELGMPFDLYAAWNDGETKLTLVVRGLGDSKVIVTYESIGQVEAQTRDEQNKSNQLERQQRLDGERRIKDEARKQGDRL